MQGSISNNQFNRKKFQINHNNIVNNLLNYSYPNMSKFLSKYIFLNKYFQKYD